MSLLEDARSIQQLGPPEYDGIDLCCQRIQALKDHTPDCPWRAMPKIVAALEAARDLIGTINWDANEAWVIEAAKQWESEMGSERGPTESPKMEALD